MKTPRTLTKLLSTTLAAVASGAVASGAPAQDLSDGAAQEQRATLLALMQPVSIEQNGVRLDDALEYIERVTGAELEPIWADDVAGGLGLEPQTTVRLKQTRGTGLDLIEKILARLNASDPVGGEATWQFSTGGAFQIGPKVELNRSRRVVIYDVQDLMFQIAPITTAPQFDLNSIFQQGGQGGGGGGQSPFQQQQQNNGFDTRPVEDRIKDLQDIIRDSVEPAQWEALGGDGASMQVFRQQLIVNAPDYVHRQLAGYGWWPAEQPLLRIEGRAQRGFRAP